MNSNHQNTRSSSSHQMEDSEMQARILELGKVLVEELGLEDKSDTLGRWMAHYIAEQMELSKSLSGSEKKEAEQRCFVTILKLWEHRSVLPNGKRPFENFESILRTLVRLDPDNDATFFNKPFNNEGSEVGEELKKWLDIAENLDTIVRIWLGYIFDQAAGHASIEDSQELLQKSREFLDPSEANIYSNLMGGVAPDSSTKDNCTELFKRRVEQLQFFSEINDFLIALFKGKRNIENVDLDALPPEIDPRFI